MYVDEYYDDPESENVEVPMLLELGHEVEKVVRALTFGGGASFSGGSVGAWAQSALSDGKLRFSRSKKLFLRFLPFLKTKYYKNLNF